MLYNVLGIALNSFKKHFSLVQSINQSVNNLVIFKIVRMNLLRLRTKIFVKIRKKLSEAPSESKFSKTFLIIRIPVKDK